MKVDRIAQQRSLIAQQLIPNTPALPVGEFSLVVIDPPWKYDLRDNDPTHRGRCPYPPMTNAEIMSMPIGSLVDNGYLLMWSTNNHLPIAFRCLEHWGFIYKSIHTWVKIPKGVDPNSEEWRIRFSTGHYGRNATEQLLVAVKGKVPSWTALDIKDVPTVLYAPRTSHHSEKPEQFYTLAERLHRAMQGKDLMGDRIELFSRQSRPGWQVWGAEAQEAI